ncbi:hypothetical protein JCGZ_14986 [Jatropha curcas]|uniref:Aminotransferase-like plant mobile domain-containing protein n=1 Tax=Jatropha curcas TaxID=180498 RepID=A0A067KIT8_JATCU|nr:hypothetical protein JCGZ_14986 [Jatropha curcas]
MSQLPEIPTSAYTPEMNTLGAILDITTFEGKRVPVSRNPLTPGTRPLQLLPLPGTEFPVRYKTSGMHGFQTELLCTSQNKGDPAVLACLRDLSQVGSYDWATPALAHLYHGLDVWTRGSGESNWQFIRPLEVWAYEYCIYPGGLSGDTPADSRQIPRYLAHCHHTFPSSEDPHYWRCFLNNMALSDARLPEVREYTQAPPPLQLDPEHATHVPAQRYQVLCRRFGFARSYIAQLYSERHERDLEIGRLRRHQSRQSRTVTRLQLEVDRLQTRLEVEGILLDFSEDEEDDDGSSSDDAPPFPPPQPTAGPSRMRR